MEGERITPVEPLEEVALSDDSRKTVKVGSSMTPFLREKIVALLREHIDEHAGY